MFIGWFAPCNRAFGGALALTLFISPLAHAQQTAELKGVVADEMTSSLIASAIVTVVGTDKTATTGEDGTFLIPDVPLGNQLVRVRADGYPTMVEDITISADVANVLPLFLQSAVAALEGIIAFGNAPHPPSIGLGRTAADIVSDRVPSIKAVAGRAMQRRNAPATFSIRGRSSFNSSGEPLIVVDGMRMTGGVGYALEVLRQIPASNVKTVQILKGAASAFLYGAADGVVIVETAAHAEQR